MNKKDKIKLSAISNIDEKYIDESTKTRIKLSMKPKKKKKGKKLLTNLCFCSTIRFVLF